MIPIKGYATFHPLKHCWIGSGFKTEWFHDLPIYKNNKIMDPLKKIAEETEEDYQTLEKILNNAGVKTYRSFLNIDKFKSLKNIFRPPVQPRDHFAVIGEKLYATAGGSAGYADILKNIKRDNIVIEKTAFSVSTATICRVGKDLWWDVPKVHQMPRSKNTNQHGKTMDLGYTSHTEDIIQTQFFVLQNPDV